MSTSGKILLQAVDSGEDGIHTATHTVSVEPDDVPPRSKKAAVPTPRSRWKRIFTTVGTLTGYMFLNAGISMIALFYPIVVQRLHVAVFIAGFVVGTAPLCMTVLSPIIGYFLPQLGLKFTQLAGLFLAGGSLILFGFVPMMPTPALFIVFSFIIQIVEGVGTAMYTTASYTQLTQFYPTKKGKIASLMQFSLILGFAVGPAVGGGLQEAAGFELPFLVVGGLTTALMLLLMVLVQPTECTSVQVSWRLILKLFSNIVFVLLVVSLVLSMGTINTLFAYFGRFLETQFHLSVGIIGVTYLATQLAYVVGIISAGQLTDRLNIQNIPRYLIIAGLVVGFFTCVLMGPAGFITSPKLWLSILTWIVFGLGMSFAVIPVYSDIYGIAKAVHGSEDEADLASSLSGILVGGISAGTCLGPIIGGGLVYKVGFQYMAAIFGLMLLVWFAVSIIHRSRRLPCIALNANQRANKAVVLIIATVMQRVWRSSWIFNKNSTH